MHTYAYAYICVCIPKALPTQTLGRASTRASAAHAHMQHMHTCTHAMHSHMHTCTCADLQHIHMCRPAHMHMCTHAAHTHVHTCHAHTHVHTCHAHAHMQTCRAYTRAGSKKGSSRIGRVHLYPPTRAHLPGVHSSRLQERLLPHRTYPATALAHTLRLFVCELMISRQVVGMQRARLYACMCVCAHMIGMHA